jgi:hypothetical protein
MIEFKYPRLADEFHRLHPNLKKILYWFSGWLEMNSQAKVLRITHLWRSQAEQEALYGSGIAKKSVHQFGRGADISVEGFLKAGDEVESIVERVNAEFPYGDHQHRTAIYHQVGDRGWHIHLQVKGEKKAKGER